MWRHICIFAFIVWNARQIANLCVECRIHKHFRRYDLCLNRTKLPFVHFRTFFTNRDWHMVRPIYVLIFFFTLKVVVPMPSNHFLCCYIGKSASEKKENNNWTIVSHHMMHRSNHIQILFDLYNNVRYCVFPYYGTSENGRESVFLL